MSARNDRSDAAAQARALRDAATEQCRVAEEDVRATLVDLIALKTRRGEDTAEDEAQLRAVEAEHEARRARDAEHDAEIERQRQEARGEVLVVTTGQVIATPDGLAELAAQARSYAEGARAENTRKAYMSDLKHYEAWCRQKGLTALPAEPITVGLYLTAHATTLAVATLTRRLSSVSTYHRLAGHRLDRHHSAIRDVLAGVRRERGTTQRHAEALTTPLLHRVLATCGTRLIDVRDRAMLVLGFGAALRRSELVALDVADIVIAPEGLCLMLRRSKTDQEGTGEEVVIHRTHSPTCPVAVYVAWLAASGITEGAVFRRIDRHGNVGVRLQAETVADMVRARAERAGLDAKAFSGHSLRAGLTTSAAQVGFEERHIMRTTRHRSVTTLRRYIRNGTRWEVNIAAKVGL